MCVCVCVCACVCVCVMYHVSVSVTCQSVRKKDNVKFLPMYISVHTFASIVFVYSFQNTFGHFFPFKILFMFIIENFAGILHSCSKKLSMQANWN